MWLALAFFTTRFYHTTIAYDALFSRFQMVTCNMAEYPALSAKDDKALI
jgi:hypothetical protein